MFAAYVKENKDWSLDGESGGSSDEKILDTDTDLNALRNRVNAHYATKENVTYYRDTKIVIPENSMESNVYTEGGYGVKYSLQIVIKELPTLK